VSEPVPAASTTRVRFALGGVLLVGLLLNAVGISWGLPTVSKGTWAYDELSPRDSPFEVRAHHGGRYPPLHYWLLGAAYAPVKLLDKTGVVDLSAREMDHVLRLVGRSVSILMSVASLWLLYRLGTLALGRPEPAILAAALMALSPTYVYYSKLTNLEVPYVFWFLVAAIFSLRILEHHRMRDYLGFGLAALCSITTKDQAFALFVLPSFAFPFLLAKRERGRSNRRQATSFLLDPRLLLPAGLSLVGFVLVHNLVFDWSGFLHHIWMMTGPATQSFAEHPPTLAGHVAMAWQAVGHIRFVLGTSAALAACGGLLLLVRERRNRALWLLLFAVSYYLLFITPLRYHYDRFFIPVGAILSVFAGHLLWRLARPEGSHLLARRIVVVAVFLVAMVRVVVLDAAMVHDTRYEVERWAAEKKAASFPGSRSDGKER
jgi:4-amino-4-deoxy-L-arabinose transferase-like glycosyltransferase